MAEIVRARVMHTPRDPFREDRALEALDDGAVAFADGRILATGSFAQVRRGHPDAAVLDTGGALLLPGLVDAHVHYPQLAVVGAMGLEQLEWLESHALPEEARLADPGAVTPRFSGSCSESMLEACGAVPGELPVTTHINESAAEVRAVAELFPWSRDYLDTYERSGSSGRPRCSPTTCT